MLPLPTAAITASAEPSSVPENRRPDPSTRSGSRSRRSFSGFHRTSCLSSCRLLRVLRVKFVGPTANLVDTRAQELIALSHAGFFPLNTTTTLIPAGNLIPITDPGKLFSPWTPQPKETDQSVAERAFALIKTLDAQHPMKMPNLVTTFRLYCIENMSAADIAEMFGCSRSAIIKRLNLIRKRTGLDPEQLRRLSPRFSKL